MVESSPSSASRTRVMWLVAGIILLNAAFDAVSYSLNPDSLKTDVMRLGAITLTGLLVARGARWARILLAVLTGLAAGLIERPPNMRLKLTARPLADCASDSRLDRPRRSLGASR